MTDSVDPNVAPAAAPVAPVVAPEPSPAPAAAPVPEWVQPRINTLTKEKFEAERAKQLADARAAAAEAALEAMRQPAVGGTPAVAPASPTVAKPPGMVSLEEAERMASAKAEQLRTAEKLNGIYAKGKELFKDEFDAGLQRLQQVGWGQNQQSIALVEAAIATGKAAEVIKHLSDAEHLGEAARLLTLTPSAMGVELARIAAATGDGAAAAPAISAAPAPIRPRVAGTGAAPAPTLFDTDKLSTAEWIKMRNKDARTLPNGKRRAGT
jgi:hypothetical protein